MAGDATGTLLMVAGDGAGLSDADGRAPVTLSVWRLPEAGAAADPTVSPAGPSLLCSRGRAGGRSWLFGSSLTASEPYCGWNLSVSPAKGRVAVAQPGGELLLFRIQVWKLRLSEQKVMVTTICADCNTFNGQGPLRYSGRVSPVHDFVLLCFCNFDQQDGWVLSTESCRSLNSGCCHRTIDKAGPRCGKRRCRKWAAAAQLARVLRCPAARRGGTMTSWRASAQAACLLSCRSRETVRSLSALQQVRLAVDDPTGQLSESLALKSTSSSAIQSQFAV